MALSKYCAPSDVITKLGRGYDEKRKSLGWQEGTQLNWKFSQEVLHALGYPKRRKNIQFESGHHPAGLIKHMIPPDIWDRFIKVATIRNPYERMISKYYETPMDSEGGKTFEQFIERRRRNKPGFISNFLYGPIHIDGKSVVDFYIRYEHLIEDVKKLEMKIACPGLSETMQQFSFNTQFRPKQGTSPYEIYSKYPKAKSMIDEDLYENIDKYELLKDHLPKYKLELEKILNSGEQRSFSG